MARTTGNRLHKISWLHGIELFEADYHDQIFDRHAHSGFAIGTITNGVGGYRCQGVNHVLPTRTLSLMNPEEAHTGHAIAGRLQYKMLYVSEKAVRQTLDLRNLPGFRAITPTDQGHVASNALRRIADRINTPDGTGRVGIEESVHELLTAVFTRYGGGEPRKARPESTAVKRAAEMIDAHVQTSPTAQFSISEIADEVGLNANYLIQCFTKSLGMPPRKYLIFKKICCAKKLMARGDSPLEAALALGFYDQAHFIRHFRKVMGVTPGQMIVHR